MLVHDDSAIMRFRKRLMMVRREYVRLVIVLSRSKTKIDHQLLCTPYSQIRMDKGHLLHSDIIN